MRASSYAETWKPFNDRTVCFKSILHNCIRLNFLSENQVKWKSDYLITHQKENHSIFKTARGMIYQLKNIFQRMNKNLIFYKFKLLRNM